MKGKVAPRVVFRSTQTVSLPDEPADGLVVETIGFLEPFGSDHTAIRAALGLVDAEHPWSFHNSESLTVGVRTIPTP